MNEAQAHEYVGNAFGINPRLVPLIVELQRGKVIIDPLTKESVMEMARRLGLKPGDTVLDLGCGKAGVCLPLVMAYKVKLTGVDILPEFVREAWARAEATGLYPNCDFITADAVEFARAAQGQWNAVLLMGLAPVFGGLEEAIIIAGRLVKPGGRLVIGHPYLKEGTQGDSYPFLELGATEALIQRHGRIQDRFDDGDAGWEAYSAPEAKEQKRLREEYAGDEEALAFLDEWAANLERETRLLGWAAWVIEV